MTTAHLRSLTARPPAGTAVMVELPAEGGGTVLVPITGHSFESKPIQNAEVQEWPTALILKPQLPEAIPT